MRHLGIDYGTRRIGLALSDEGGRLASPLDVLYVTDPLQAVPAISAIVAQEHVGVLVVGLPMNMDGTEGPAAQGVRAWARMVAERAARPLVLVDERLMGLASASAIFMHCLPARRGKEVSAAVIDGPASRVWRQAANRLHSDTAVLYAAITGDLRADRV